jgi:murein DD-endopeptidase MepM/ murein hydrolase activator NlpD
MKVSVPASLSIPGGVESLRGRKDPEAVRAVAREMESLFAYEMVKAMRATANGPAGGKGFGNDVYGSLFDMQLARVLASRGLGLQDLLLKGFGGEVSAEADAKNSTEGNTMHPPGVPVLPPDAPVERRTNAPGGPAATPFPGVSLPIRDGGRLSSGFGYRKDPFTGKIAFHHGVDIAAAEGTPVYPVRGGMVAFSGYEKGYGNVVVVDHGDGFVTKYAHNRANRVSTGDSVDSDKVIAEVGGTGRSTGPHLHFEVRYEGKSVRPDTVLAGIAKGNG